MIELAIDGNGEPFDVPERITSWRVRRQQQDGRGRPELVYDATGRPILLPVRATHGDVLQAAGPGRYRLDPVDASGRTDESVPTAVTGYMQAPDATGDGAATPGASGGKSPGPAQSSEMERLLANTIQQNTLIATTMITNFSAIMARRRS
jgi:hypothetical protein